MTPSIAVRCHVSICFFAALFGVIGCETPRSPGKSVALVGSAESVSPIEEPPVPVVSAQPAASVAPQASDYNRDADIARRTEEAKKEFGSETPVQMAGGVFLLVGAKTWRGGAMVGSSDLVERAMVALYNNRFTKKPEKVIPVYLFGDSEEYNKFCKKHWNTSCLSKYGSFHPDEVLIVMNAGLGLGTLTHEMVHPLIEADFPEVPTWLNEGIASLYEAPVLPKKGEIHGVRNWRHPRLTSALGSKEKKQATIDVLFGMSDGTFRDDFEDLHYSMARYTCQWLDQHDWLWPFYQRYRDSYKNDKTGENAFKQVTGKSPRDVKDEWVKWVRGL